MAINHNKLTLTHQEGKQKHHTPQEHENELHRKFVSQYLEISCYHLLRQCFYTDNSVLLADTYSPILQLLLVFPSVEYLHLMDEIVILVL